MATNRKENSGLEQLLLQNLQPAKYNHPFCSHHARLGEQSHHGRPGNDVRTTTFASEPSVGMLIKVKLRLATVDVLGLVLNLYRLDQSGSVTLLPSMTH